MGHLDLSAANIHREDAKLSTAVRDHDGLPQDHFWTTVYGKYEADIRETGNDHRFARWHPWVDREFHQLTPIPIPVTIGSAPPPPSVSLHSAAVPEPSGALMLGIAVLIATVAIFLRK